jgi:regulatory protein
MDPPVDPAVARARALRLLARREHSARELQHKLEQRGIEKTDAVEAVRAMTDAGWQSDSRYVDSFIRNRVSQGYGPLRSGVVRSLIRESLASAQVDWKELAQEAWARKFGAAPATAAEWQKQFRFLAGRGFDAGQIRYVLKGQFAED